MGATDVARQSLNVFRMRLLGADVRPVTAGTATLKDATSEAIRHWVTHVEARARGRACGRSGCVPGLLLLRGKLR